MSDDLASIFEGWPFEPDRQSENVRTILGDDGRKKIQIRVKCGIIQWEAQGRPDGQRPHGFESMLEYCEYLLAHHKATGEDEESFRLTEDATAAVREEIMDYYHRRVMRFQLTDYEGAKADAEHNLRLMGFIKRFVDDEEIVMSHEQYRPFVLMDRARASAMVLIENGEPPQALDEVLNGIAAIRSFYAEYDREDLIDESQELQVLSDLREGIREQYSLPFSPHELIENLEVDLEEAVEDEDYERAAKIKQQIELVRTSGKVLR